MVIDGASTCAALLMQVFHAAIDGPKTTCRSGGFWGNFFKEYLLERVSKHGRWLLWACLGFDGWGWASYNSMVEIHWGFDIHL